MQNVIFTETADKETADKVQIFLSEFTPIEVRSNIPLLINRDKKCGAFYAVCHIEGNVLTSSTDLEAVLDPDDGEDYKLNRNIYKDNYAYAKMEADAVGERSFEDIVVEFDKSYRPEKPLKVFGGQHRIIAIRAAEKRKVSVPHGIRVYFNLNRNQKAEIALANNTSITVSNDLLDRMQEDWICGNRLRVWCQNVGLLRHGENFADRRDPNGVLTVRIARTLLVNYFIGKDSPEEQLHLPVVCSSGRHIDPIYNEIRPAIDWSDSNLVEMGKQFTRLHGTQRERIMKMGPQGHIEFVNKAIHPCVTAAWAYAAGMYQNDKPKLSNHYALTDVKVGDPLGAGALNSARLQGVDPDTYRGLGARISSEELGRMLQVFVIQATRAKERGISLKLANAAIKEYQANKLRADADKALKGV